MYTCFGLFAMLFECIAGLPLPVPWWYGTIVRAHRFATSGVEGGVDDRHGVLITTTSLFLLVHDNACTRQENWTS
jgi:hypothetical protein